jgi:hypothetical protein
MKRPPLAAVRYDSDGYPHGKEWDMNMTREVKWFTAAAEIGLVRVRSRRGTAAENVPEVAA